MDREPRRFEFYHADTVVLRDTMPVYDALRINVTPDVALWLLRCIANDLAASKQDVSVLLYGSLKDKGPR